MKDKQWLRVALPVFCVAWGGNEFTPLLVHYREQQVLSDVVVDLMLAYYAVGVAVGLLGTGPLSDRFGRKALMMPAPLVALVASVLIAIGEQTAIVMGIGRFLAGAAVGMAMTAGGSWIKELSTPRFDRTAKPSSGAMRVTMSLTAGFGLGAGVAGLIAQWVPLPGQMPFIVHIVLTLLFQPLLFGVQETRQSARHTITILPVRAMFSYRFLLLVATVAPWVFGAGFVGNAILPAQFQPEMDHPVAFTGLFVTLVLAAGFTIQRIMPVVPARRRAQVGLLFVILAMVVAVFVVDHLHVWTVALACVLLGLGYGSCMYAGLSETIDIAAPNELGALSGVFYSLTYIGMFFPAILTALSGIFTYPQMLGFGASMAVLCFAAASIASRRIYPAHNPPA